MPDHCRSRALRYRNTLAFAMCMQPKTQHPRELTSRTPYDSVKMSRCAHSAPTTSIRPCKHGQHTGHMHDALVSSDSAHIPVQQQTQTNKCLCPSHGRKQDGTVQATMMRARPASSMCMHAEVCRLKYVLVVGIVNLYLSRGNEPHLYLKHVIPQLIRPWQARNHCSFHGYIPYQH